MTCCTFCFHETPTLCRRSLVQSPSVLNDSLAFFVRLHGGPSTLCEPPTVCPTHADDIPSITLATNYAGVGK